MWYVIQTLGGEEERTVNMVGKLVPSDYIEECFVPKRERLKKYEGCWHKVEEILFHGYAFVASKKPEELYHELKRIPKLTKVLGREENFFLALDKKEEKLIRGIGDAEHKTSLSRISVEEGKRIRVIDGPLKNYAGDVVKVDLHKREVIVKVGFMGRQVELKMGIEMIEPGKF